MSAATSGQLGRVAAIVTMVLIFATLGTLASGANWPVNTEQRDILLTSAGLGLLGALCGFAAAMLRRPALEPGDASLPLNDRLDALAASLANQIDANHTMLLASLAQSDQRLQRAESLVEQQAAALSGIRPPATGTAASPAVTEAMLHIADITTRTSRQVERLERVLPELVQALTVLHAGAPPQAVCDRLSLALTQAEAIATASERVGGQMATLPAIAERFEDLHTTLTDVGAQIQSTLKASLAAPQPPISTLADAVLAIANRIETLNLRVETASGAIAAAGDGITSASSVLTTLTDETLPQAMCDTAEATHMLRVASQELAWQLGGALREEADELAPVLSRVRAMPNVAGGAGSDATRMQQIAEWRERHARKSQERMAMLRRQATGELEVEPEPDLAEAPTPVLLKNLQVTIGQMQSMAAALAADSEGPRLRSDIGVKLQR